MRLVQVQHYQQQQQQQEEEDDEEEEEEEILLPLRLQPLPPIQPHCSSIPQLPSLHNSCNVDTYRRSNCNNAHLLGQPPASSTMLLLDITTIQGFVLYTLYLLHRLRFFRWRDTRKITPSYRRLSSSFSSTTSSSSASATGVASSSLSSADTGVTVAEAAPEQQGSQSARLDESGIPLETTDDRSTATEGAAGGGGGGEGVTAEPHTIKDGDTSSLFRPSSSTSFPSSSSSSSGPSSLSSTSMLPYIFSSSAATMRPPPPLPSTDTLTRTLTPSSSINNRLPPEILVKVFQQLASHPRMLIRCTLVCHSWYTLVGPLVWKSPRVLWSRHWSRFHPITAMSTRASVSSASSSATEAAVTATETATSLSPLNHGDFDDSSGTHSFNQESVNGPGSSSPLSLQLQLQQILLQQAQQRQLAWLHLWQVDRAKALASDRLHEQDRRELQQWLLWKKREKARRLRELRRRRHEQAVRLKRQQQQQQQSREGFLPSQQMMHEDVDSRGRSRTTRNATSRTHSRSRSRSRTVRRSTTIENGGGSRRRSSRRRRRATTAIAATNDVHNSDDDEEEEDRYDDDEDGSDDSDSEEEDIEWGPMSIDSNDGGLSDKSSDYEASDDETPMMKLVSRFDALHAWISSSTTALQDVATVLANTPSATTAPLRVSQPLSSQEQQQQQQLLLQQQQSTRLPFKGAIARIRRRQAAKECRRRLAKIQSRDGLPVSLPLRTCGQWIQVISLQQEMPFHQRVMTQSFMQHPPLARGGRHAASMRSRAIQLLQQQQQLQQEDQGNARYGVLGSVFRYLIRQPQGPPLVATNPSSEPERLLSRRDFVNDWTVKTIMDHCPGLCRLTLSECHGITDRSLELIRDSACVANRTLVSLHLAGCSQITDRGLLGLVGTSTKRTTTTDLSHEPSTSLSSSISPFSLAPIPTQTSTAQSTPTTFVRLESLDFAGCHQISDKGMIPLLKQCGSRLLQLRVSDCEEITSASVVALANHCPNTQWLDLCRTGILTEESLILLAERCTDLEWLNLARINPGQLESLDGLEANNNGDGDDVGDGGESNVNNNDGETEESEQEEEVEMDDEKILLDSNGIHHSKTDEEDEQVKEDSITDRALALLCESCPKLQLLDLSYISTISNNAMESLSETAKSLVCLTIIGCPGITSQSLLYLARLRNSSGKLGCITMGDALGISERDIEQIMQGTLSGWQKSLVDETNLGEILGRSWDE